MSSKRRIRHIAEQRGLDPHTLLGRLAAAGFPYTSVEHQVSQQALPRVLASIDGPPAISNTADCELPDPRSKARTGHPTPSLPTTATGRTLYKTAPKLKRSDKAPGPLRHRYDLPIVGNAPAQSMSYLTPEMVLRIHYQLVEDFAKSEDPIDPPGTRDRGELLESALGRPQTSLGGVLKYPTIEMASAALLHAIIHNHAFHNGNKRTAIVSFLVFLHQNGYVLTAPEDELFSYVLALAAHEKYEITEILDISDSETISAARWVANYSRKSARGERRLQWRKLRNILTKYDCEIENREGNSVAIRRGHLTAHTGRRNEGDELDASAISSIRKKLHLDDEHGIDSIVFYEDENLIPQFINKYRRTLTRLSAY